MQRRDQSRDRWRGGQRTLPGRALTLLVWLALALGLAMFGDARKNAEAVPCQQRRQGVEHVIDAAKVVALLLVAAGLLVGIGTRLANGCTSGHGVCGMSRLSPRGIVATLIYLLAGAVTVALFRHVWGVI